MIPRMKQHLLVIALCLPGALCFGWLGVLIAAFSAVGPKPPSGFTVSCLFFWGVLGGASIGALPGLLFGWYQGFRWVYPILWAAAGALVGLIIAGPFPHLPAGLVLAGFIFGCRPFYHSYRSGHPNHRPP
jgi:hypothetical protein